MIEAVFRRAPEKGLCGLEMSGHAGFDDPGRDIVCAAVTSALLLTVNGITELLGVSARADVAPNKVDFWLPLECPQAARDFLGALRLHLEYLAEDYPGTIHLTISEV